MGTGEELDFNKAFPMKTGFYILHPTGAVHFDGARDEETIVQIVGIRPVETVKISPAGARVRLLAEAEIAQQQQLLATKLPLMASRFRSSTD